MKKYILPVFIVLSGPFIVSAQRITFDDGTSVNVNQASFDYESIRRASLGMVIAIDGLAGSKVLTAAYLQPRKFHIAANVGFSGASLETTIFFKGQDKEREREFAVKYESGGYNTIKKYILRHAVIKRKELGVYLAINDYGHLWQESGESRIDAYPFLKQTQLYLGFAAVNYWHANINVDDNYMKRGQYTGRTIIAPFICFGSVTDTISYTKDEVPKYGARLLYELSNTFGLMGPKIRGRTNMVLRLGIDLATDKNKNFYTDLIFGFGIVYNFAEGVH